MIDAAAVHQVFQICIGDSRATAFTVEHKGRQYLVSAAHVFSRAEDCTSLSVYKHNTWIRLEVSVVGVNQNADTIVLLPKEEIAPKTPLIPSAHGVTYSQDVYFLGFPFGITPSGSPTDRPFPFVKRACLSAVSTLSDRTIFYLDGHNNPGFSGGPVVFRRRDGRSAILAVISGYKTDERPVRAQGSELPITFKENAGIILSYDIKHAIELIERSLLTS